MSIQCLFIFNRRNFKKLKHREIAVLHFVFGLRKIPFLKLTILTESTDRQLTPAIGGYRAALFPRGAN
jgi:hypothetical protein